MSRVTKVSTQARDAQVITAIQKHLPATSSIPLGGSTYSPADLVKLVQSHIDSANSSTGAKANWHSTVLAERELNTRLTALLRELRHHVIGTFGANSPVLADFGFAPSKRATRTPEQKAASAVKAKATRAARHTAGKNQKKAVKGDVTGIVVTPVTASSGASGAPSPGTTPTPAPGAPPTTPAAPAPAATSGSAPSPAH